MADPIDMPDDPALLAAELALGVLEGEALVAAKRRMLTDPAFAAGVEDWRARLAAIGLDAPDAIPSEDLWARIERSIDSGTGASVADLVPRRALRRWQWGTAAAGSVAAALAVLLAIPRSEPIAPAPQQVVTQPAIVAQLRGEGEGPLVAARYDPATAQLRLVAQDMGPDARVPELWIIPADGIPRSLGVIQPAGDTQLVVAEGHRSMLHDGATLAITMEPRDTAPHPAPTGPRVAAGKIFGI
ncbi:MULTISPECIES: anti-sigma factor domain-containing protein [unclassified Sphingomonas]|uniref:anti-sigma factor n=1 Tax=unclassified Sphingomonas TaxID=196159 RepID=UPI002151E7FB|nr:MULTISPECIES: anti-sigma factor [unclassified Sphingomonas]MCR5871913.1 anti-sigma factor [Sphingomonas sp. J344]UUX99805.1 anti-sigma factor [Sphingomonas sp. J315]